MASPYKKERVKKQKKHKIETKKKKDLYNYSYLIVLLCARVKEEWSVSSKENQWLAT